MQPAFPSVKASPHLYGLKGSWKDPSRFLPLMSLLEESNTFIHNRFRPFFHWLFDNARCNQPNGQSIRCKIAADIPTKSLTSQKKRIDMLDETTILPLLKDTENERTERTVSINATEKFGQAFSELLPERCRSLPKGMVSHLANQTCSVCCSMACQPSRCHIWRLGVTKLRLSKITFHGHPCWRGL